jgi:hypothetical protein
MTPEQIMRKGKDITLENVEKKQKKFCEVWPNAKIGLELLIEMTKNPMVKGVIGIVIAGGDVVAKKVC